MLHDAPAGMFEDEADTISVDPGFDTQPIVIDAFEATRPIELKAPSDTFRDTGPLEMIDAEDDTDLVIVNRLTSLSDEITGVRPPRPTTNADWPPAPKQPANRKLRTAGMYKAISSITKLTSMNKS